MKANRLDYIAAGALVVLLGISAQVFLSSGPTQEEVNELKGAMPALATEDFARLVKDASLPDGVPWEKASVLHTEPPFEDWYGWKGAHSLKINVVAQRQDGTKVSAMYRVALDDRACTKQPKSCASLDGISVLAARNEKVGEAGDPVGERATYTKGTRHVN